MGANRKLTEDNVEENCVVSFFVSVEGYGVEALVRRVTAGILYRALSVVLGRSGWSLYLGDDGPSSLTEVVSPNGGKTIEFQEYEVSSGEAPVVASVSSSSVPPSLPPPVRPDPAPPVYAPAAPTPHRSYGKWVY